MSSDTRLGARSAPLPVLLFAGLLCAFLQLQASFQIPGVGPKGLRLNFADLLLPLAVPAVLYSIAAGRTLLPRWRMSFVYAWLAALTGVLALALGHSYFLYGHISSWALANKFAGWFVLLAYFGIGSWLAANYGETVRRMALTSFTTFFLVALALLLILTVCGVYSPVWGTYRQMIELQGFMGNRNAYAFLAMATLIFLTVPLLDGAAGGRFRIAASILWFLLPLTLYYNGSRTFLTVAALFFVVVSLWRFRDTAKVILPPLLAGMLLCVAVHHIHPRPVAVKGQTEQTLEILRFLSADPTALAQAQKLATRNTSEAVRLRVLHDSLTLWRTHPLTGIGLGSFWDLTQRKYAGTNKTIEIIDCTPLWLLTETGVAGLTVFIFFFASGLLSLAASLRKSGSEERAFLQSVIILLACFAVMSLFQELLYTRFLWFIMGMAFARTKDATELPA